MENTKVAFFAVGFLLIPVCLKNPSDPAGHYKVTFVRFSCR